MSKNKINKRVGLFLLAIVTVLGFTFYDVNFNAESNVYAANGCGVLRYKKNGKCKDGSHSHEINPRTHDRACDKGWGKPDSSEPNCSKKCASNEDTVGNYCKKKASSSTSNTSNNSSSSTSNNSTSSSSNSSSSGSSSRNSNRSSSSSNNNTTTTVPDKKGISIGKHLNWSCDEDGNCTATINGDNSWRSITTFDIRVISNTALQKKLNESGGSLNEYLDLDQDDNGSDNISDSTDDSTNNQVKTLGHHVTNIAATTNKFTVNRSDLVNACGSACNKFSNVDYWVFIFADDNDKYSYTPGYLYVNSDDMGDDGSETENTAYNTNTCNWARTQVTLYQNDDFYKNYADSVKKALGVCFKTTTTYNTTYDTLNKLRKKLDNLYKIYKDYKDSLDGNNFVIAKNLPELDTAPDGSQWIQVNNTDLSKNTRTDGNTSVTNKTGYELAGSEAQNKNMLTCAHKLENKHSYKYLYYETSKDYSASMTDFTSGASKKKDVKVCTTKCREQLVVSFGPPKVVSNPGQCFTYKVEVKSTTTCAVDIDFSQFPSFEGGNGTDGFRNGTYEPCSVKAKCSKKINGYTEQGGPTVDFDQCVKTCDGGKYSSKCVNKCYSDVYSSSSKSSNTKKSTTNTDKSKNNGLKINYSDKVQMDKVVKLANEGDNSVTDDVPVSCPSISANDVPSNPSSEYIDSVYKYVAENITGNFSPVLRTQGSLLHYSSKAGCYWNTYGYPYFRTKTLTARTVCNDYNVGREWYIGSTTCGAVTNSGNYKACHDASNCYPGAMRFYKVRHKCVERSPKTHKCLKKSNDVLDGGLTKYVADENGFKINQGCNEKCKWVAGTTTVGGKTCYYNDREKAEKDYLDDVQEFIDTIQNCVKVTSKCDTKKASYEMVANDDTSDNATKQTCDADNYDSNKTYCKSFPETSGGTSPEERLKTGSTSAVNGLKYPSIVQNIGGSCAENNILDDGYDWRNKNTTLKTQYHTVLTFPGAWVDNKTGDIAYSVADSEKNYYREEQGKYCTPLTAKAVNVDYWFDYQYSKLECYKDVADKTKASAPDVYNILTKIKDFGKYEWTFDAGCFYAVNPDVPPKVENTYTCTKQCPESDPDCNKVCVGDCCNSSCSTNDKKPSYGEYATKAYTGTDIFPKGQSNKSKSVTSSTLTYHAKNTKTISTSSKTYKSGNTGSVKKVADGTSSTTLSRNPGFNWTVDATYLAIKGYPITPTLLRNKMASDTESNIVYSDSENLDYTIVLSQAQISKIKSEVHNDSNYFTSYNDGNNAGGKFFITRKNGYKEDFLKVKIDPNGDDSSENLKYTEQDVPTVTFYHSKFIRDHASVTKEPSGDAVYCNNIQKGGTSCDYLTEYDTDGTLESYLNSLQ